MRPSLGRTSEAKSGTMSDFIDLPGASGTLYRFRRVRLADLPATAGNLVVAIQGEGQLRVLFCGAARSLSHGAAVAAKALQLAADARVYIRLNVARPAREAEHSDIVAGVSPEAQATDLG